MTHYSRTLTSEAHYDDRSCARPLFRPACLFRIAVADPRGDHPCHPPPPLELVPILKTYMQSVRDRDRSPPPPPPWNVDDVTRAMSKGVCACKCLQEWGCFSIFRRADDVTRTMSKGGGCLWMSSLRLDRPPPKLYPISPTVYLCEQGFSVLYKD